jgi:hypothetical protein
VTLTEPSYPGVVGHQGAAVVYSSYLGGGGIDNGQDVALDSAGNVVAVGGTFSADLPTTPGAYQPAPSGLRHAFATKVNSSGSAVVYSTYLGGSLDDLGVEVDRTGSRSLILSSGRPCAPVERSTF